MNLGPLLEPRSVAIVGASAEPKKLSGMIVDFLARSGYAGRAYAVNPRYARIGAVACYASVDALPETVDLLVCAVPVAAAFEAIEAGARRGVPFCLLMTGGFGEGRTGEEGDARRQRLLALCERTGMHVVGPNTVGMVNFRARLPLTFADWYARDTGARGGVAIVTHSGSVGGLVFSMLQANGIGVDYWLGLGNEATLETADFIAHFSADPAVHTVICYLEGVRNGRNFMRAAAEARSRGKRVIAILAGGRPESARSTHSHTGKRPARADVYSGIFRQLGVIEAASLAELGYVMQLLSAPALRVGARIGIVSASGGACSLIADHVLAAGLALPLLPQPVRAALDAAIPAYGSSLNPVDLSADVVSRPEILDGALMALRAGTGIDVWLVFGRPIVDRYYPALIDFARTSGQAVIVSCGVAPDPAAQAALREAGIAVLDDPELCLRALGRIVRAMAGSAGAEAEARSADDGFALANAGARADTRRLPAPDDDTIHAAIENDRDFGPVLALQVRGAGRAVRALPASAAVLHDALSELAAAGGAERGAFAHAAGLLQEWIDAVPAGAAVSIELSLLP